MALHAPLSRHLLHSHLKPQMHFFTSNMRNTALLSDLAGVYLAAETLSNPDILILFKSRVLLHRSDTMR